MNKQLKNIGIATLVAGALIYPAIKLYQYLAKSREQDTDANNDNDKAPKKTMRVLHHTKHVPHHMAAHNGHANPSEG